MKIVQEVTTREILLTDVREKKHIVAAVDIHGRIVLAMPSGHYDATGSYRIQVITADSLSLLNGWSCHPKFTKDIRSVPATSIPTQTGWHAFTTPLEFFKWAVAELDARGVDGNGH